MLGLFTEYYSYIVTGHVFFMAVGVGGATITDVLFFKFLKDKTITEKELSVMRTLSQVIWAALFGIVVTGLMLFLPEASGYLGSGRFLAKMTVVAVLLVNGVLLNVWITPKMTQIFPEKGKSLGHNLRMMRKFAFALGAISIVSWYSAFILGSLRAFDFSYQQIIGIYLALLFIAITGSQISESLFAKKKI